MKQVLNYYDFLSYGWSKVFENDQFTIMVPESKEASCYYGAGTKWCVASTDTDSHYNNYKKSGELYYIIDKTKPTSDPTYKVALNKKLTGEEDFWNAVDKMITDIKSHKKKYRQNLRINELYNRSYVMGVDHKTLYQRYLIS